jgi:hypothetical protein
MRSYSLHQQEYSHLFPKTETDLYTDFVWAVNVILSRSFSIETPEHPGLVPMCGKYFMFVLINSTHFKPQICVITVSIIYQMLSNTRAKVHLQKDCLDMIPNVKCFEWFV